ncbi:MAG: hypothetical protein KF754_01795 [Planctomycetes bacterium]|nr:hypothetical protein [Planctomycetota bacterium]
MESLNQVTISGEVLTIERLAIQSRSLCSYIEGFPSSEHGSRIRDALEIGAEVLTKARAKSETDYVDKRFAEVSKEFGDEIGKVIAGTTSGLNGMLASTKEELSKLLNPRDGNSPLKERFEALDKMLETIKQDLAGEYAKIQETTSTLGEQFDPEGGPKTSHLAKLKALIIEFETRVKDLFNPKIDGSYAKLLTGHLEGVFDPKSGSLPGLLDTRLAFGNADSPFGKFRTDIDAKLNLMREKVVESIGELKKELEGYRAQVGQAAADREKMSAKGDDFEAAALELLTPFAEKRGDSVWRVGTEVEVGASKKGDLNYSFSGNAGLVAVEARNKDVDSIPKFTKDLLGAVRNRNAGFGILVVRDAAHLPKSLGEWHFDVSPDGIGYIFTHSALLELSLKFAHARLRYTVAEVAGVDVSALGVLVSAVAKKLKDATTIKKNLTAIETTVSAIRTQLDDMTGEINSQMQKIEAEVDRARSSAP